MRELPIGTWATNSASTTEENGKALFLKETGLSRGGKKKNNDPHLYTLHNGFFSQPSKVTTLVYSCYGYRENRLHKQDEGRTLGAEKSLCNLASN